MLLWNTIHFAGMGLQIAAAIVGGGLCFSWLRVRDKHVEVSPERVKLAKRFSYILLWVLAAGFILELWYETHLLG